MGNSTPILLLIPIVAIHFKRREKKTLSRNTPTLHGNRQVSLSSSHQPRHEMHTPHCSVPTSPRHNSTRKRPSSPLHRQGCLSFRNVAMAMIFVSCFCSGLEQAPHAHVLKSNKLRPRYQVALWVPRGGTIHGRGMAQGRRGKQRRDEQGPKPDFPAEEEEEEAAAVKEG